jgi:hypothetical protein
MPEDLVLLTRLFDLLAWIVPKSESFPKPFRHTVTHRLVSAALDCQEEVFAAQSSRGAVRLAALARADAALNALHLYLRLAHRWRWLNDGQYEHVSKMVAEVGRLLGGWIRQSGASGSPP